MKMFHLLHGEYLTFDLNNFTAFYLVQFEITGNSTKIRPNFENLLRIPKNWRIQIHSSLNAYILSTIEFFGKLYLSNYHEKE